MKNRLVIGGIGVMAVRVPIRGTQMDFDVTQ